MTVSTHFITTNTPLFNIHLVTVRRVLDRLQRVRDQLFLLLRLHSHKTVLRRVRYHSELNLVGLL